MATPAEQHAEAFSFTVQGIWEPQDPEAVRMEMRAFSACTRWAFARLILPEARENPETWRNLLKQSGQGLFRLNSRYVGDAILEAGQIIDSQVQLLPLQLKDIESRLEKIKKQETKTKRALKTPDSPEAAVRLSARLDALARKKTRLEERRASLQTHIQNGTIAKVVFGSRALLRRLTQSHGERHMALRRRWRLKRQGTLYARGDKTKRGNPNIRVDVGADGSWELSAALSHQALPARDAAGREKVDKRGRPIMQSAPRVTGRLRLTAKFALIIRDRLLSGEPYSVRVMERPKPGAEESDTVFRVHITWDRQAQYPIPSVDFSDGTLGIDENPHGLALANVGRCGNLEPFPEGFVPPVIPGSVKGPGEVQVGWNPKGVIWLHVPELRDGRADRRGYLSGVAAAFATEVARGLGKPIAMEELDFGQRLERGKGAKRFNRLASQFNCGQVIFAIERRTREAGVATVKVNPAFTSVIGSVKYQQQLGLSVHESAALTIGRRALGCRERVHRVSGRRRVFWGVSQFVPSIRTTALVAGGWTDGEEVCGGT